MDRHPQGQPRRRARGLGVGQRIPRLVGEDQAPEVVGHPAALVDDPRHPGAIGADHRVDVLRLAGGDAVEQQAAQGVEVGLAVALGAVRRREMAGDGALFGGGVRQVERRQAVGQVHGQGVPRPAVIPDQRLDAAAVGDGQLEAGLVLRGVAGLQVVAAPVLVDVGEGVHVPRAVGAQAPVDRLEVAAPGLPRPGAVAEPGQGGEGQDALAEAVELELHLLPVEPAGHPQQPVRIVGEPVQVAQAGALQVAGDDEPGGRLQAQHGVPPAAEVVGDRPASRGQVVPLRVEPSQQVAAAQLHGVLQLHSPASRACCSAARAARSASRAEARTSAARWQVRIIRRAQGAQLRDPRRHAVVAVGRRPQRPPGRTPGSGARRRGGRRPRPGAPAPGSRRGPRRRGRRRCRPGRPGATSPRRPVRGPDPAAGMLPPGGREGVLDGLAAGGGAVEGFRQRPEDHDAEPVHRIGVAEGVPADGEVPGGAVVRAVGPGLLVVAGDQAPQEGDGTLAGVPRLHGHGLPDDGGIAVVEGAADHLPAAGLGGVVLLRRDRQDPLEGDADALVLEEVEHVVEVVPLVVVGLVQVAAVGLHAEGEGGAEIAAQVLQRPVDAGGAQGRLEAAGEAARGPGLQVELHAARSCRGVRPRRFRCHDFLRGGAGCEAIQRQSREDQDCP